VMEGVIYFVVCTPHVNQPTYSALAIARMSHHRGFINLYTLITLTFDSHLFKLRLELLFAWIFLQD
jgi:hypothetical protein